MERVHGGGRRPPFVSESDPAELLRMIEQKIASLENPNRYNGEVLDDLKKTRAMLVQEIERNNGSGKVVGTYTLRASRSGGNRFGSGHKSVG